jgi:hypothetical protein
MGTESESTPSPSEILLSQIAAELGVRGSSGSDILAAVRQLRTLAKADAEGSLLYWSIQHGNGSTTETDDDLTALRKFREWKDAHPDDRIELVKIVGIPVDGQNLHVDYDSFGRRIAGMKMRAEEFKAR